MLRIMDSVNSLYPVRAFIRHKAYEKVKLDFEHSAICLPLDEALFMDLASTLLREGNHPHLRKPCQSRIEAAEIEDRLATKLANAYRRIKLKQHTDPVQRLNALL